MLQIFFKSSRIKCDEWNKIYLQIRKISENYPLSLLRLESYDGFSPELDKLHTNIVVNKDLSDEHISFWGDSFTCNGGTTVKFYKDWNLQMERAVVKHEEDDSKPITWAEVNYGAFSGEPIHANGKALFYEYFDTNYVYGYAVLSIGMLLENLLPGRVLLIVNNIKIRDIINTKRWVEWLLNEKFDMPVYLDKLHILYSLVDCYKTKTELVGRMEMLYESPFSENMAFSIEHIGYKPTLDYYSRLLADNSFGTFGFSDILQPWIKATKDLDKTLQLIDKSKQFLMSDPNNENNLEKANKYDYSYILKKMLSDFVLWTPEQRERLEVFYTNKNALETGEEDLFGSLMRIGGYRVDICPIYATETQLFETFMFFDPKNGAIYKKIVDEWIKKNRDSYNKLIENITSVETKATDKLKGENNNNDDVEKLRINSKVKLFVEKHDEIESFMFEKALKQHPYAIDVDASIAELNKTFSEVLKENANNDAIINFYSKDKAEKIKYLKYAVKEKRMYLSANADFEEWIEKEDNIVLTYLYFLARMRIYTRDLHFARQQIFLNNKNWEILRKWKLLDIN